LSADSKPRHPEIDAEVRRMLGRDASSDSFDYHLLRLFVLIERKVEDKELAREMLSEIRLMVEDLNERIHRL